MGSGEDNYGRGGMMRAAINIISLLTDHKIEQRDIREEWTDPAAAPPVTFNQRLENMTSPSQIRTPPTPLTCAAPPISQVGISDRSRYRRWAGPQRWRMLEDDHAYFIHLLRNV